MANRSKTSIAAFLFVLLLTTVPAKAQVFDIGSLTNTLTIGSDSSRLMPSRRSSGSAMIDSLPLGIAVGRSVSAPPGGAATRNDVVTSFTPSKAVRQRNLSQFVAKTRAVDAKAADDLQKTFASRDLIAEIGRAIAPFGLRTNDVVDASAAYLATAWYGAQGRDDTPSQGQIDGLRAQMGRAIAATPQFATASPAQKQELTEALLIQALLVGQAATYVKSRPELRASVAAAVAKGARATFGFDLTRMSLTARGLRPR